MMLVLSIVILILACFGKACFVSKPQLGSLVCTEAINLYIYIHEDSNLDFYILRHNVKEIRLLSVKARSDRQGVEKLKLHLIC